MAEMRSSSSFAARGGWWVVAQSILMLAAVMLAVMFQGRWTNLPIIVTGSALFAIGAYFGIAGVVALGKNRTPFPEPRVGAELVQHGIYGRVRHPLYTSVMLASLGWALLWQSGVAVSVALLLVPFFNGKARREERSLVKTFSGYADYAQRVPRFLPRLGRKTNLLCNF